MSSSPSGSVPEGTNPPAGADGPASTGTPKTVTNGLIVDLRDLNRLPGFRKLFGVRLISQSGDGLFQISLATLFFFSPQNLATASAVAGAFAVMLLPFTIVGPFAGPFLDRWSRRQVLLFGNLIRVGLTLLIAAIMATQGVTAAVYVLALVTLGVNRFLLAGLSAGLPKVVPTDRLLTANALTPTLGGVASVVGAAVGLLIGVIAPAGVMQDSLTLVGAAIVFGFASLLALTLGKHELGPDRPENASLGAAWEQIRGVAAEIVSGARYLIARGTPARSLGVMGAHRFLYGVNFIALILMSRNLLTDPGLPTQGLAMFGLLGGISFAGNGIAIVATPIAHRWVAPWQWILICLGIGTVSQVLLAASHAVVLVAISAALLGLSAQGAKIAVDTIVQRDTADAYRGRAFTLYDTTYNAAFCAAAVLAAIVLPDTGWSPVVFVALAVAYVAVGLAFAHGMRTTNGEPKIVPEG